MGGALSDAGDSAAPPSPPPGLATTLMDATTDKDPLVHEQIFSALCYLGGAEPEEILNVCEEYLRQHDKVRRGGWRGLAWPLCARWGKQTLRLLPAHGPCRPSALGFAPPPSQEGQRLEKQQ